jgi:hypothetical protein
MDSRCLSTAALSSFPSTSSQRFNLKFNALSFASISLCCFFMFETSNHNPVGGASNVGNGRFGPVQYDPTRSQIHSQFSHKHRIIFHKRFSSRSLGSQSHKIENMHNTYLLTQQKDYISSIN